MNWKRLAFSILIFSFGSLQVSASCGDCVSVDFGKKIQIQYLKPMLRMSTPEKIAYVQSFGIEVYKAADPEKIPVTIAWVPDIPLAQNPGLKSFADIFKDDALGLYLTPSNYSNQVKKSTMLLIESADDWTIMHEFAHYLFDRARSLGDSTPESLKINNMNNTKEDFFEAWSSYRNNKAFTSENHKQQMVQSFISFTNIQIQFLKVFQLEESTIEKLMTSLYTRYSPAEFKDDLVYRSRKYIRRTTLSAQETLRVMLETCEDMRQTLGNENPALLQAVNAPCAEVQQLKIESLNLVKGMGISLEEQPGVNKN